MHWVLGVCLVGGHATRVPYNAFRVPYNIRDSLVCMSKESLIDVHLPTGRRKGAPSPEARPEAKARPESQPETEPPKAEPAKPRSPNQTRAKQVTIDLHHGKQGNTYQAKASNVPKHHA